MDNSSASSPNSGNNSPNINRNLLNSSIENYISLIRYERIKRKYSILKLEMIMLKAKNRNKSAENELLNLQLSTLKESNSNLKQEIAEIRGKLVERFGENIQEERVPSYVFLLHKEINKNLGEPLLFCIGKLYEKDLNQLFHLESKDPFIIHPIKTDVYLRTDYLIDIKKVVLHVFQSKSKNDGAVPLITIPDDIQRYKLINDPTTNMSGDFVLNVDNMSEEENRLECEHNK